MHPKAEQRAERSADLLARLDHVLAARRRRAAAVAGQREVHVLALEYLARANRYSNTPQAVADYLGLTKGTVSQTLLRLRERGWLTERADPKDGRRRHLELTPEGRERLAASQSSGVLEGAIRELGAPEEFELQLERLLGRLQASETGRRFGVCSGCRHRLPGSEGALCGLTGDRLELADLERICRLYEPEVRGGREPLSR